MKKNILKIGVVFCIMASLVGISPLTSAQQVVIQVVDEENLCTASIEIDQPTGISTIYCGGSVASVIHDIPAGVFETDAECTARSDTPTFLTSRSSDYVIFCRMGYNLESYNPPHEYEADEITFELYLEFDGESISRTVDLTESGSADYFIEIDSQPRSGITSYYFSVQTKINGYSYVSDHDEGDVRIIRRFSFDTLDLSAQAVLSSDDYDSFFL